MSELEVQNKSAVYYEKRYSGYGLKYHRQVIDWMMEGVWPDWDVLDAGCGTGIIERLYPYLRITGYDLSSEMISRCPEIRDKWWYTADVCKTREKDSEYDAVVCRSLLHHLPDHKKALSEFHRVLKSGGRLMCWETNKGLIASWVRSKTQHGDRFSEYHHAFKPGELEHDIKDAGFEIEEVRYMGFFSYLFGFPDIIPLEDYIPFKPILFPLALAVDYLLESLLGVRKLSWAIGIKSRKI